MQTMISEIAAHEGETVTLKGWLYNARSGGKIRFLLLRDGTGTIQCVASRADVGEETFELILYDADYYETLLGDSKILFQYKTVNNVDVGNYEGDFVAHGQYATVGIEDPSSRIGLQYTYNNEYATAAKPLQNEMAIMFTNAPIPYDEPYLHLETVSLSDENGNNQVDCGETVQLSLQLNNIGASSATNVQAVLLSDDEYVEITEANSSYEDIAGGTSQLNNTPFSITIAENCPDGYLLPFRLEVSANEGNWSILFSLNCNAPDVQIEEVVVDDGTNHILDPGETSDVILNLRNLGGFEANQLHITVSSDDEYITINSSEFEFESLQPDETGSAVFNVTASEDSPVGHEIQFTYSIEGDLNYFVEGTFQLYLVQVPVDLTEDFSLFPPVGWTTEGGNNWIGYYSNYAGGAPPEAIFINNPQVWGIQRLISEPVNTLGSSELELSVRQYIVDYNSEYTIGIETTSDGEHWHQAVLLPSQNAGPAQFDFTISTADVGSPNFRFAFVFSGYTGNITGWVIDDVHLQSVPVVPHGYLVGNIILNGGNGNVEDVTIVAEGTSTNPDENGHYILSLIPGTYNVSASLAGYVTTVVENVEITDFYEITNLDMVLEPSDINYVPQNVNAVTEENNVILSWEIPGSRNSSDKQKSPVRKSDLSRFLLGYNIYRNSELIGNISDINTTSFTDNNLAGGIYEYYVTAIYEEGESVASETVTAEIVFPVPSDFTANQVGANVVTHWNSPDWQSLSGFHIYRDGEVITETAATFYIDTNAPDGTHEYYVTAIYGNYESEHSNSVTVDVTAVDDNEIQQKTELYGNIPNPFHGFTSIYFSVSNKDAENAKIEIFNLKGQKVRELSLDSSLHEKKQSYIVWDGKDDSGKKVNTGIYFFKMKAGDYTCMKKMILMR